MLLNVIHYYYTVGHSKFCLSSYFGICRVNPLWFQSDLGNPLFYALLSSRHGKNMHIYVYLRA